VDVVPTVLELAGVRPAEGSPPLQGQSLLAEDTRRAAFGETNVGDRRNPQVDTRTVVTTTHKYVYRPGDVDELYDLQEDPEEMRNVAGAAGYAAVRDALRRRLQDWRRETDDRLALTH
jgi:choline-sulfatase